MKQVMLRFLLSLVYAAWIGVGITAIFGLFGIPITIVWTVVYVSLLIASWIVIFLSMSPNSFKRKVGLIVAKRLFSQTDK